jgi:hypothetical protein
MSQAQHACYLLPLFVPIQLDKGAHRLVISVAQGAAAVHICQSKFVKAITYCRGRHVARIRWQAIGQGHGFHGTIRGKNLEHHKAIQPRWVG